MNREPPYVFGVGQQEASYELDGSTLSPQSLSRGERAVFLQKIPDRKPHRTDEVHDTVQWPAITECKACCGKCEAEPHDPLQGAGVKADSQVPEQMNDGYEGEEQIDGAEAIGGRVALVPAGCAADRQVQGRVLGSDNLIQTINGLTQLVWGSNTDLPADSFNRECSNLTCLHP